MQSSCEICGGWVDGDCCTACVAAERCVICYMPLDSFPVIRCTECSNFGHKDHVLGWLDSNKSCPVCRVPYSQGSFEELVDGSGVTRALVLRERLIAHRNQIFSEFSFSLPYYDYQSNILDQIMYRLSDSRGVLLNSPPGSGKTIIGYAVASNLQCNTLVLVPNLSVLGSWIDRAEMFFDPEDSKLKVQEVVGQDTGMLRPITLITYQKLNSEYRKADKGRTLINQLHEHEIRLIIFDEAHRLAGKWGDDTLKLLKEFPDAKLLGLTATPPKLNKELSRKFRMFFRGNEVSIPFAPLVRAGVLAPWRDFIYFLPESSTMYNKFPKLVQRLNKIKAVNTGWIMNVDTQDSTDSESLENLIDTVKAVEEMYAEEGRLQTFHDRILLRGMLEMFVVTLMEGVSQFQLASMWLLTHSHWQLAHLLEVVRNEYGFLGDSFRGLILLDQESTKPAGKKWNLGVKNSHELFSLILKDELVDSLDPVLITGRTILVDDDLVPVFLSKFREWIRGHGYSISVREKSVRDGYSAIWGSGKDWGTVTSTRFVTSLFEDGVTKLIIGTRHLFGEGWDSLALNTMFDLTETETKSSVNQIKGRVMRKDPRNVGKVSHIWEFCPSPKESKWSVARYINLIKRHVGFIGVQAKTGRLVGGITKLHPSLVSVYPNILEHLRANKNLWRRQHTQVIDTFMGLNSDKVTRQCIRESKHRARSRNLWRIGEDIGQQVIAITLTLQKVPRHYLPFFADVLSEYIRSSCGEMEMAREFWGQGGNVYVGLYVDLEWYKTFAEKVYGLGQMESSMWLVIKGRTYDSMLGRWLAELSKGRFSMLFSRMHDSASSRDIVIALPFPEGEVAFNQRVANGLEVYVDKRPVETTDQFVSLEFSYQFR